MFWSIFSHFDLFRQPMVFYYNGYAKRSSSSGLLSSMIIYLYLFYSFFQSDLYKKESPIVVIQNIQSNIPYEMQFDQNKIFAFSIVDTYKNPYMDPGIFSLMLRVFPNSSYFEVLDFRPCLLEDVQGNETLYNQYQLNMFYCPDNSTFLLNGTNDDETMSYATVSLMICENSTSNNTCKSPDEISNFFNTFSSQKFFGVFYSDIQSDLNDYNQPFKKVLTYEICLIDPEVKKRLTYYFKEALVETDSGWLFPDVQTQSNFMYDYKDYDFQMRTDPSQPVFQYLFFSSKDVLIASRRYQTISEFMGAFSGVANFIIIVCGLFVNSFVYVSTLKYILNKIYAFPIQTKKKKKMKLKKLEKTRKLSDQGNELKSSPANKFSITEKKFETYTDNSKIPDKFDKQMINCPSEYLKKATLVQSEVLKKDLKKDSFILEHYSDKMIPITEKDNPELKKSEISMEKSKSSRLEVKKEIKTPKMTKRQKLSLKVTSFFKNRKEDEAENKKLHISYWEYITVFFKRFKKKKSWKHKMIRKAENTYIEELDVVNVVTKIHDLEKLKILLLDEDQLVLFNYLSKPIINLDDDGKGCEEHLSISQRRMTNLINRGKNASMYLEESYRKLLNRKNDKLSEKLIGFFDEEIYAYYTNKDLK